MSVTTRKQKKDIAELIAEIPDDYPTQLQTQHSPQKEGDTSVVDGEVYYSTSKSFFDLDPTREITLEMIYYEMRVIKHDIAKKIKDTKDEIIIKLQNENLSMKAEIETLRQDLDSKSLIIDELKSELKSISSDLCKNDDMIELERESAELQQYTRRNNIEIAGIPDHVEQQDLEAKVIEIAKAVNITISSQDIEACHRLNQNKNQNGPKRTIVRFVNRKFAEKLIKQGKEFKKRTVLSKANLSNNLYINNNLCSYYRYLWGKVKSLYNKNAIESFWVFNGTINVRFADNNNEVMKVTHLNDLIESFPNHKDVFYS